MSAAPRCRHRGAQARPGAPACPACGDPGRCPCGRVADLVRAGNRRRCRRRAMKRSERTQAQVARDHLRATGEPLNARGREWRGPCPACGGDDRFRVAPSGHFHCRRHPGDPQHFKAMCEALGYRLDKPSSDWREARAERARWELALTEDIATGPVGREDPDRDRILAESRAGAGKAARAAELHRILAAVRPVRNAAHRPASNPPIRS